MDEIKNNLSKLLTEVSAVKSFMANVCSGLLKGINTLDGSLTNLRDNTKESSSAIVFAVEDGVSAFSEAASKTSSEIAEKLSLILDSNNEIYSLFESQDIKNGISELTDKVFQLSLTMLSSGLGKISLGGGGKPQPTPLGLPASKSSGDGGSAANGIVGNMLTGMGVVDESTLASFEALAVLLKDSAAATWLQNAATTAWQGISTTATAVTTAFGVAAGWFNANVVQPVAGFFAGLWNGFKQAAVSAWEGVKSVFSTVASFFGDIFGKAWAGVVKVFSAAGNVFNNIKDGILTVFKSIVNGLIDGINAVVSIPFQGLNSALTFVRSVEIAGIRPFSGLRTLSVPQIPHLARDAYTGGPSGGRSLQRKGSAAQIKMLQSGSNSLIMGAKECEGNVLSQLWKGMRYREILCQVRHGA